MYGRGLEADYKRVDTVNLNVSDINLTSTWYKILPVTLVNASTETAYYEIWLASTGVLSSAVGQKAWSFDATKSELLGFQAIMPTDYKEGTAITPYIHWLTTSSTGSTQAVRMLISYMWTNQDASFASTATEESITISTTGSSALKLYTTNFTAIATTSLEVGSIINGCIARLSSGSTDDFSCDFWLQGMSLYYQVDGVGSTAIMSDK